MEKPRSIMHALLDIIPHKRVVSNNNGIEEIFDLYQLGLFSAEIIELVELQPGTSYKPHYHKKSAAVIYIISGNGEFLLGEDIIFYDAKKRIEIPAGVMHGFNTMAATLFLSIQSPPIFNYETGEIDLFYQKEDAL